MICCIHQSRPARLHHRPAVLFLCLLACFWPLTIAAIKIMPLGDSITQSDYEHASYRYWLYKRLVAAGNDIDFVGSQTRAAGGDGNPLYSDFDKDFEAYWGQRIEDLIDKAQGNIASMKPDIVLVLAGANNFIVDSQTVDQAIAQTERLVDVIRAGSPNATILLSILPPCGIYPVKVMTFGERIPDVAAQKNTAAMETYQTRSKLWHDRHNTPIAPGDTVVLSTVGGELGKPSFTFSGNRYFIVAQADDTNIIPESNPDNNSFGQEFEFSDGKIRKVEPALVALEKAMLVPLDNAALGAGWFVRLYSVDGRSIPWPVRQTVTTAGLGAAGLNEFPKAPGLYIESPGLRAGMPARGWLLPR
jgi:hypothetical protein